MDFLALKASFVAIVSAHLDLFKAAILGVVEGLTEFLPVSSTGHLLLMEHFLGWGDDSFGKSFAILIQLGAILALLTIFFTLQLPKGGFSVNWWGNTVFMNSASLPPLSIPVDLLTFLNRLCTAADFAGTPLIDTPPDHPLPN